MLPINEVFCFLEYFQENKYVSFSNIYRSCSCMVECTTRIYCWELKKKGVVSLNEFKPRSKYSAKFKHMIVFSILLRCYYMLYGLIYLVYAISNTIINDNLLTKLKTFSDCMIKVI